MLRIVLGTFLVTGLKSVDSFEVLTPPTSTRSEIFPYHAVIETDGWWCNGVIISKNFILTRASCIIEDKKPMIYLGHTRNPYISTNLMDSGGQTFHADKVYVYDEFGKVETTKQYINNLALIKLHKPIALSATVQPVALASPDDFPIPAGTYMNVTGFLSHEDDGNMHYSTVQMRDMDSCELLFGDSFLRSQERCAINKGLERIKWAGPYVVNGKLVGIQRSLHADAKCMVSSPPCDIHDVFLSLEMYLEWIYRISDIAGEGAVYFKYNNPYWEYRPDKIQKNTITKIEDTVVNLQGNVQQCKQNENYFISNLQSAIQKNLKQDLKSVVYTVDLA